MNSTFLTEDQIEQLAGATIFQRGDGYEHAGRVLEVLELQGKHTAYAALALAAGDRKLLPDR